MSDISALQVDEECFVSILKLSAPTITYSGFEAGEAVIKPYAGYQALTQVFKKTSSSATLNFGINNVTIIMF